MRTKGVASKADNPRRLPAVDERALTKLLNGANGGRDVMLVGHEPDLGELLSFWLTGSRGANATSSSLALAGGSSSAIAK